MNARKPGSRRRWPWLAVVVVLGATPLFLWLVLQRGITLDHLAFGPVEIGNLDLVLDRKLVLTIDQVSVASKPDGATEPAADQPGINPGPLKRILKLVHYTTVMFRKIEVKDIRLGSASGRFRYLDHEPGYLTLSGPRAALELAITGDQEEIQIELVHLEALDRGIVARGHGALKVAARHLSAQLEGELAQLLPLTAELEVDQYGLSFKGRGLRAIPTIAPIVELLRLGPAIAPWIADYLVGSSFELQAIGGTLPFDEPAAILQTLTATVHIEDLAYTFAQGLEPVRAPEATVVFADGVLAIAPDKPTFYGHDGKDSAVDINFNDGHIQLTADIRAQAPAAGGIITLLKHYHIPFPLEQTGGLADVDLTLGIDLKTIATDVSSALAINGSFRARDADFLFGGLPIHVADLDIALRNTTELTFHTIDLASGPGLPIHFAGNLTGFFDPARRTGRLTLATERFQWPAKRPQLRLQAGDKAPAPVTLQITPGGDSLALPRTRWRYGPRHITINPVRAALDLKTLAGRLPATKIAVDRALAARVQGDFNLKALTTDLGVMLTRLDANGFRLAQRQAPLTLRVNKGLQLASSEPVKLAMKGVDVVLSPSSLAYAEGRLRIDKSGLRIGEGLRTDLTAALDTRSDSGRIVLSDLASHSAAGTSNFAAGRIELDIARIDAGRRRVHSPELGLTMLIESDGSWSLDCPDLGTLSRYSPLMQREHLKAGHFHLQSAAGSSRYQFKGRLEYPYALLMNDDKPNGDFDFTGWHEGLRTQLTINGALEVKLGSTLQVTSKRIGYNMTELARMIKDAGTGKQPAGKTAQPATGGTGAAAGASSTAEGSRRVTLRAADTFLWLDAKHRILADKLLIQIADGALTMTLQHGPGLANLELKGHQLTAGGNNFNNQFIRAVVAEMGDIRHGTLEFRADGDLDDLNAVFAIRNTVIRDFKALNNMLAFINTLPGLMTFKPPGYDSEGLPTREISASLNLAGGTIDLKSMLMDSAELTVRGTGKVNIKDDTVDMTFNLVTGANKSISSIPVLGFILEGREDQDTIALMVTGDLHNPAVTNTAFQEVVAYPFKVLARTILLPVHWAQTANEAKEAKNQAETTTP